MKMRREKTKQIFYTKIAYHRIRSQQTTILFSFRSRTINDRYEMFGN